MNAGWKNRLHEEYREKFGCKNLGEVCWCSTCVNIEKLINETVRQVKEHIPD